MWEYWKGGGLMGTNGRREFRYSGISLYCHCKGPEHYAIAINYQHNNKHYP